MIYTGKDISQHVSHSEVTGLKGRNVPRRSRLLLERLLLGSVCKAYLHLHFFAMALDGKVVEGLDDLLAGVTTVEAIE